MDWKGIRVLVTGADGFLGKSMVSKLGTLGAHVRSHDRYHTGLTNSDAAIFDLRHFSQPCYPHGFLHLDNGRLQSIEFEEDLISELYETDTVFHLAGQSHLPEAEIDQTSAWCTNYFGTVNLARSAILAGVRSFVYPSTVQVYGEPKYLPVDEEHPLEPVGVYATSKAAAESRLAEAARLSTEKQILWALGDRQMNELEYLGRWVELSGPIPPIPEEVLGWDMVNQLFLLKEYKGRSDEIYGYVSECGYDPYAILEKAVKEAASQRDSTRIFLPRLSTVYGPGQDERKLVSQVIKRIRQGGELWHNGAVRDFIYMDDVVNGLIGLAGSEGYELSGEPINISTGVGTMVGDLQRMIAACIGVEVNPKLKDYRTSGEVRVQYASNAKAKERLGWQPEIDLDEGLARTVEQTQ